MDLYPLHRRLCGTTMHATGCVCLRQSGLGNAARRKQNQEKAKGPSCVEDIQRYYGIHHLGQKIGGKRGLCVVDCVLVGFGRVRAGRRGY